MVHITKFPWIEWIVGGKLYISATRLVGGLQAGLINKGNACGNARKCETFVTTLKCLCIASIFKEIIRELKQKTRQSKSPTTLDLNVETMSVPLVSSGLIYQQKRFGKK